MSAAPAAPARQRARAQRVDDAVGAMAEQYGRMLQSAHIGGDVEQTTGALSSSVLVASMLQSADELVQISRVLECDALLSDRALTAEAADVSQRQQQLAADGEQRLRALSAEMQSALRELEESYYAPTQPCTEDLVGS